MWGTSSPDDKLTGDLGNVIETTQIGGRRSDRLTAGKLSPGNFGLLQQYRHKADLQRRLLFCPLSARSGHAVTARGVSIVAIDPNQSCGAVMLLATAAWLAKAREKRKNSCRFGVHSENLGYVYFLY
jgi:hypothetical protein